MRVGQIAVNGQRSDCRWIGFGHALTRSESSIEVEPLIAVGYAGESGRVVRLFAYRLFIVLNGFPESLLRMFAVVETAQEIKLIRLGILGIVPGQAGSYLVSYFQRQCLRHSLSDQVLHSENV